MAVRPSAGERFRQLLRRTVEALQQSAQLIAESRRVRTASEELRSARVPASDTDAATRQAIWASPDKLISCAVIAYTPTSHEVVVNMAGQVVASKVFLDPVEATDEAERLRHLFLDPVT
jgi:hypothetical protein